MCLPPSVDVDPVEEIMIDIEKDRYIDNEMKTAVSTINAGNTSKSFDSTKQQARGKLQLLMDTLETCGPQDIEAIRQLNKHLTSASSTFDSLLGNREAPLLLEKSKYPSNKNIEVQRFFSTRRKRKRAELVKFAKPGKSEKKQILKQFPNVIKKLEHKAIPVSKTEGSESSRQRDTKEASKGQENH